jgi:predicted DNA binding CopG/RHH family protein
MRKIKVPKFKGEAEEAKWWDAHMRDVEANLVEGIKKRTTRRGGPQRAIQERRESKNITIRVAVSDIERARALAAEKGLGYQTFMKMLLKEALDRESGAGFARPKTRVR